MPPGKDTFSVELLILWGGCLSKVGRHTEALNILRQAYAHAVELFGERSYYAGQAANQLGVTCGRLAMEEESEIYFNLSMEIDRANMAADSIGYYISLVNVADIERSQGNYFKAWVLVSEALEGLAKHSAAGKKSALYGQVLVYASGIEYELGDLEGAEKTIREALQIIAATLTQDSDPYIQALIVLGVIEDDQKKHKKAMETAFDALERFPRVYQQPDTIAKLTIKSNLCIYYERLGQRTKALQCNEEVLAEKQQFLGPQHPDYILSLRNKAAFHFRAGEYAQADTLYTLALQTYRETADSLNFDFLGALHDAGWLKEAMGQTSAAQALYLEMYTYFNLKLSRNLGFLSEQQKERFLKHNLKFPNTFFSFVAKQYQQDSLLSGLAYDQLLNWKGLIFSSQKQMLNSIAALNDTLASALYIAWKADKLELSRQISFSKAKQTLDTDSLAREIETKEAQLARKSTRFQQTKQAVRWRDVQARLAPNEAAVEFHQFRFKDKDWTDSICYAALVLRPGWAQPRYIPLCSEAQLREALETRDIKSWEGKLEKLYGEKGSLFPLIWQPLDAALPGVQKIWYSPSGLLHNISFSALQTPGKQYLLHQYRLERLTSTRELALQALGPDEPWPRSALLYGGIRYDSAAVAMADGRSRDIPEENRLTQDS
ncbi:MAG: tetratricopeptide repeat protein, partial [Saprospiraceae bacterium]|nr:tetratricopeptide repeat protein [Saprospiraceae bacterium]